MEHPVRVSHLRLRRIRFKDGRGTVEVFRSRTKGQDRADVEYYVRQVLNEHDDRIAGFGFVVWTPDSTSTAMLKSWTDSPVAKLSAPDFVRERLMYEVHEKWMKRT